MNSNKQIAIAAIAAALLSGCAGYDKMAESVNGKLADGYTTLFNGGQKLEIEQTSAAKGLKLNLVYRMAGTESLFAKLVGDVVYDKSCRFLSFDVSMTNPDKAVVGKESVTISDYTAGEKTLIDQHVNSSSSRNDSGKVATMLIKHVKCLH